MRNDFLSLWKIPLPDGQSLLRPHAWRNLSPSLLLLKRWLINLEKLIIYLLEQIMIIDQLLLNLCIHTFKRVEFTLEISFELLACCDYLVHDVHSLLLGDTWSEWESIHVSSNSDSCREDHGSFFSSERWAFELGEIHITDVHVSLLMTVIVFNDLIE